MRGVRYADDELLLWVTTVWLIVRARKTKRIGIMLPDAGGAY